MECFHLLHTSGNIIFEQKCIVVIRNILQIFMKEVNVLDISLFPPVLDPSYIRTRLVYLTLWIGHLSQLFQDQVRPIWIQFLNYLTFKKCVDMWSQMWHRYTNTIVLRHFLSVKHPIQSFYA